jgi:hypothetical protein
MHPASTTFKIVDLRVSVLAPLVVLVVKLSRKGDVGNNDNVKGAGSVLGSLAGVTTGVVLVLARAAALPGMSSDGNGRLGGSASGRSA